MMSLIVALLGRNCGVVASDSIEVSPQGEASFGFDKTFSLQRPLMIGVHLGLLEFAGAKIADHVRGIAAESKLGTIREVADLIALELIKRLNLSEIAFEYRKVELFILSRKKFHSGRYEIRSIELIPNSNTGVIDYIPSVYYKAGGLAHSGDKRAREYVEKFLHPIRDKIQSMKKAELKKISLDLITHGIAHCGKHPRFPNVPACGGPPCAIGI